MTGMIRSAGRAVGAMLLFTLIFAASPFVGSTQASPVTNPGAWAAVAGSTGDATTISGSYTAGAGNHRLLLVAVTNEFNADVDFAVTSATFGGQALTPVVSNTPSGQGRFAIWVGFLDEAGIAAAGAGAQTLTVNWSDNSTTSSRNLFAATFADVSQTRPVQGFASNATSVDAPITFGTPLNFSRDGAVIYVAGYGGTNTGTTQETGFTAALAPGNRNASTQTIAHKDDVSTGGVVAATADVDFAGTFAHHGLVAVSLNPAYNPLIHNSQSTGSTKHSGNWGTPDAGSTYGEFTCATCHGKGTGNIKRVKGTITAPSGSFPGGLVSFQDAIANNADVASNPADFGNDAGGHTTSTRVCEVCHTQTKYHRYNTAGQASTTHFNETDCTECHAHSDGFKAGACDGCHGGDISGTGANSFWPDTAGPATGGHDDDGRHTVHMDALAQLIYGLADSNALLNDAAADTKQVDLCGYCHDSPGADGDHSATMPAETAFHPVWSKATSDSGTGSYSGGDCANSCHNEHDTAATTYGWYDAGTSACIMCHNDITADGNATGETHNDHVNAATNFGRSIGCADCHSNGPVWATTAPSANHLDGNLDIGGTVTLTYNVAATPPGTDFNGCGTNSCHNDGTAAVGAPVNNSYVWGDNPAGNCGICHAAAPGSNAHSAHNSMEEDKYGSTANASWDAYDNDASDTTGYDFGCGQCHGDTLNNHLNGSRQVAGTGWSGGSCSTAYCHSHKDLDGVTTVYVTTPAWTGSFLGPDKCAECHKNSPESSGHEEHQIGFHYNAIYSGKKNFLPVRNSDPKPMLLMNAAIIQAPVDEPYDTLRGHGGYSYNSTTGSYEENATTMTCYVCHNNTVNTQGNDLNPVCGGCHDGSVAPLQGTLDVANTNFHVNGTPDVVFMDEKVRSKAQVRDELLDVPELSNNWTRVNDYKRNDGSSYDIQPDTLYNMANLYGGWVTTDTARATLPDGTQPARTCMISCHLWEDNRVDKYPVHWDDNSIHGPQPIMCIDCHTRLPK